MAKAPTLSAEIEVAQLNNALKRYRELSGKTPEEVLLKQGGNLTGFLRNRLRTLMPAKGQVRAQRLALLAQGVGRRAGSRRGLGVHVREKVRQAILTKYGVATDIATRKTTLIARGKLAGNRTNYLQGLAFAKEGGLGIRRNLQQLMVERELNLREQGRGFLSISSRYPKQIGRQQFAKSKYGPFLSALGLNASGDTLTLQWDPSRSELQASATTGLSKPRASAAIALALRDTTTDVNRYVIEKLRKNAIAARLQ